VGPPLSRGKKTNNHPPEAVREGDDLREARGGAPPTYTGGGRMRAVDRRETFERYSNLRRRKKWKKEKNEMRTPQGKEKDTLSSKGIRRGR